jgi:hypothetical protein
LIGVIVCAPVVLAELYLRSLGLGYPILYYANASYRFAPQPNQKQLRLRDASVTLDSKGLRSTKDWSDPADEKILFIGDSVTWAGTYIDDGDTFSEGVCQRLAKATGKSFTCGNAGTNPYGTDNMAERIRYKDFDDESALVVTLISTDTVRGLADAAELPYFGNPPPPPFRALWEATTIATWVLLAHLRGESYRDNDDLRVAKRSLENLFAAIRETQRPGRKTLIVFSPREGELNGHGAVLTKYVQSILAASGFEVLDLSEAVSKAVTKGFYYDHIHLDVIGHRFYADQITSRLEALMHDPAADGTQALQKPGADSNP